MCKVKYLSSVCVKKTAHDTRYLWDFLFLFWILAFSYRCLVLVVLFLTQFLYSLMTRFHSCGFFLSLFTIGHVCFACYPTPSIVFLVFQHAHLPSWSSFLIFFFLPLSPAAFTHLWLLLLSSLLFLLFPHYIRSLTLCWILCCSTRSHVFLPVPPCAHWFITVCIYYLIKKFFLKSSVRLHLGLTITPTWHLGSHLWNFA